MPLGINTTYANEILDYLTGQGAPTAIAALYIKLHLGDPGAAGAGNPAAETTRIAATMSAASGGAVTNSAAITWSSVAATETVSHISAWDASTAGNFLWSDDLATPRALTAGDTFEIAAGDLDLDLAALAS